MTPLMHAAYKGRTDICRLLLQHGANVNCNQHEYGYTALMFAALSGEFPHPASLTLLSLSLSFSVIHYSVSRPRPSLISPSAKPGPVQDFFLLKAEFPVSVTVDSFVFVTKVEPVLLLPGKTDITSMILDEGAETDPVNSVGRTAAQMAAFVGEANVPLSSGVTLRM